MIKKILSTTILLMVIIVTPAMAHYSNGKIFKKISYEDFNINKHTGIVSFIMINKSDKKVTIFVKARFCNIFNEYCAQVYIQKTINPNARKKIRERLYKNIAKAYDSHHINWYVRLYEEDGKVIINHLADID